MMQVVPKNIDVVLLCGGLGKRIQSVVNDRPKPMAEIKGRPFLDILIDYAATFGFRRFILCIGYMGNFIKRHYQGKRGSLEIIFSEEKELLGTAGAIKNAESLIGSSPFLVMNGDSFCPVDLHEFINFHITKQSELSLTLATIEGVSNYGMAELDESNRIVTFVEKGKEKNGFISGGVYLFNHSILSLIPSAAVYSLEYNLFPALTNRRCYGYVTKKGFIDIGTPEGYENAKQSLLFRTNPLGDKR